MVESLTTLLREEAGRIAVPPAPAPAILRSGRSRRRRRRLTESAAAVAAVAVAAVGVGTLVTGSGQSAAQERFAAAPAGAAYHDYGAFSVGSTVYVGNHRVTFPERIKALYYTSLGVLVRMGDKAITDEPGPSHYTLVHPDGTTRDFDLRMGDRVAGTDPDSPFVAYTEADGERWDLVAVSLETGAEVARTTVDAPFTWGGWEAPPVDTAGTRMWALFDTGWMEFDWSTGTTRMVPGTAQAPLESAHGRFALHDDVGHPDWQVFDFATGKQVRTIPTEGGSLIGWLSPDGRYVRLDRADAVYGENGKLVSPPSPAQVASVDTGTVVPLPGRVLWGWTPDGNALSVDPENDRLTVCDPGTGSCDRIHLRIGSGKVKLGGLSYES